VVGDNPDRARHPRASLLGISTQFSAGRFEYYICMRE
jgi:hypothetical protein